MATAAACEGPLGEAPEQIAQAEVQGYRPTFRPGERLLPGEALFSGNGCSAVMQTDCNFVVYDNRRRGGSPVRALWASHTRGAADRTCRLVYEPDGVLHVKYVSLPGPNQDPREPPQ